MRRREFIGSIVVGSLAAPLAGAEAKTAVIGVLVLGSPDPQPFLRAFREGLAKLGYREPETIRIELRSANGRASGLAPAAAELVRLKVDVIVAWHTPAVQAAKEATSEIPIVMGSAGDPVGTGLIASLAYPGGNITGVSGASAELGAKNLELVRELLPNAHRVAVLANETDPFTHSFLGHIEAGARSMGIAVAPFMIRPGQEQTTAFQEMRKHRPDALIVQPSIMRNETLDLALSARLPSLSPNNELPRLGGLASYSARFDDLYRTAAGYVDKILKGSNPADLPVRLPTTFELVINLKTAKTLGLEIPPLLLARADEVIE